MSLGIDSENTMNLQWNRFSELSHLRKLYLGCGTLEFLEIDPDAILADMDQIEELWLAEHYRFSSDTRVIMANCPPMVRILSLCCPACDIIEDLSLTRWQSEDGFGSMVTQIYFLDVAVNPEWHTYDETSPNDIVKRIRAAVRLQNELLQRGGSITPANWINGLIDWANNWGSCWCEGSFTHCGNYEWAIGDWDVGDRCRHGQGASDYRDGLRQTRLYKDDQGMLAVKL